MQTDMFPLLPMGRIGVLSDSGMQGVVKLSSNKPFMNIQKLHLPLREI